MRAWFASRRPATTSTTPRRRSPRPCGASTTRVLVYRPRATTKYSNAGIAVAGYVLERPSGEKRFAEIPRAYRAASDGPRRQRVRAGRRLDRAARAAGVDVDARRTHVRSRRPSSSAWRQRAACTRRVARPRALHERAVRARANVAAGRCSATASLDEMWTPQFAPAGARNRVRPRLRHRHARRPTASFDTAARSTGLRPSLPLCPTTSSGVAVVITKDGANAVATRIATAALRLMARDSDRRRRSRASRDRFAGRSTLARRLDGSYGEGNRRVELVARDSTRVPNARSGRVAQSRLRVLAGDTLVVGR